MLCWQSVGAAGVNSLRAACKAAVLECLPSLSPCSLSLITGCPNAIPPHSNTADALKSGYCCPRAKRNLLSELSKKPQLASV